VLCRLFLLVIRVTYGRDIPCFAINSFVVDPLALSSRILAISSSVNLRANLPPFETIALPFLSLSAALSAAVPMNK
jgi:hypothetical protein